VRNLRPSNDPTLEARSVSSQSISIYRLLHTYGTTNQPKWTHSRNSLPRRSRSRVSLPSTIPPLGLPGLLNRKHSNTNHPLVGGGNHNQQQQHQQGFNQNQGYGGEQSGGIPGGYGGQQQQSYGQNQGQGQDFGVTGGPQYNAPHGSGGAGSAGGGGIGSLLGMMNRMSFSQPLE
jgi:hypothetical protein